MESDDKFEIPIKELSDYQITKTGKIWSNKTNKYLTSKKQNGYKCINLMDKGYSIHRLVALTFIPNPDNKPYVNHIDENKLNGIVVKVKTESAVVYLMGIVTEKEASLAADIASRIVGTKRVVRAFEVVSEDEIKKFKSLSN